ncbi:MAG: DUF1598 domain-containing protein [Planctomycetaceae bacterium]
MPRFVFPRVVRAPRVFLAIGSFLLFVASTATPASAQGIAGLGGATGVGGVGGVLGGAGGLSGAGGIGGAGGLGGIGGASGAGGIGGAGAAGGAGGIMIDADGVIVPVFSKSRAPQLARKRREALAGKHLSADVNAPSPLRKISLTRLEKACEKHAADKTHVTVEMQYLAGLQRIDYVFVDVENKDIVIAGPAEGFAADEVGRIVGVTTGRPPIRIDDLMTGLRAVMRGERIGCSIDPDQQRLAQLQNWLKANSTPASAAVARARYGEMARILGTHHVSVWGVPADSHFGQALVEADYRMKLLALGLERSQVRGFTSYLAVLGQQGNTTQRWWFTPLYDAFHRTEEGDAFQIAGQRAQLLSQDEVTDALGNRKDAAFTRLSTSRFAQVFTDKFPELAEESAALGELQNLIDIAVVAALLKKERLPQKVDWKMSLFLDPQRATLTKGNAPKEIQSMYNVKQARGAMLGVIAGGVEIDADAIVASIPFENEGGTRLSGVRAMALEEKDKAENDSWWWD